MEGKREGKKRRKDRRGRKKDRDTGKERERKRAKKSPQCVVLLLWVLMVCWGCQLPGCSPGASFQLRPYLDFQQASFPPSLQGPDLSSSLRLPFHLQCSDLPVLPSIPPETPCLLTSTRSVAPSHLPHPFLNPGGGLGRSVNYFLPVRLYSLTVKTCDFILAISYQANEHAA